MLLVFSYNGKYGAASISDNSKEFVEGFICDKIQEDDITIDCDGKELILEKEYDFTIDGWDDETETCFITNGDITFDDYDW